MSKSVKTTLLLDDGVNIDAGTSTGSMFGTSPTKKLGWFGATPIVRPSATTDIKQALVNLGLLTGGGATPLNLGGAPISGASAVPDDISNQQVGIYNNGTLVAKRKSINLIPGTGVTLTVADNSGSNRVDVTIASSGGSGSSGFDWGYSGGASYSSFTAYSGLSDFRSPTVAGSVLSYSLAAGTYVVKSSMNLNISGYWNGSEGIGLAFPGSVSYNSSGNMATCTSGTGILKVTQAYAYGVGGSGPSSVCVSTGEDESCSSLYGDWNADLPIWLFTITTPQTVTPGYTANGTNPGIIDGWMRVGKVA